MARWMAKRGDYKVAYLYSQATMDNRDDMIEISEAEALEINARWQQAGAARREATIREVVAEGDADEPALEEVVVDLSGGTEAPKRRRRSAVSIEATVTEKG